jgi:hypothetical protein
VSPLWMSITNEVPWQCVHENDDMVCVCAGCCEVITHQFQGFKVSRFKDKMIM